MGCSRRTKVRDLKPEQKWDFISLQDFKATSFFEYIAYGYLYLSLLISIAVYGVDTFTAYNLITLDEFAGFKPAIDFDIAKWIFVGCIIASWVNVIYEHVRAWRTIARGAVAESCLDSLAVRLQSIRIFGRARGWRRFLVFSELTKSKKGAEYVALFTYFSFQSWIRVIFCSGPRQVVNALTLKGVYDSKLISKDSDAATAILRFFENFGELARKDSKTAVILSGMTFTLVIWVFAALSLLLALCFYLLFLWHYIPNGDGGLSGYCERKIDTRLAKIVSKKVNAAIEEEERKRQKELKKLMGKADKDTKGDEKPTFGRQATIPVLFESNDDKQVLSMLSRNDTQATLPQYTSRPATPLGNPTIPDLEMTNMDRKRPGPSRLGTGTSNTSMQSYSSNAPLMAGAAEMGTARPASPAPSMPRANPNGYPFPGPQRTMTGETNMSNYSRNPQAMRNGTPGPQGPQSRMGTPGMGPPGPRNLTPLDRSANMTPMERTMSPMSYGSLGGPVDRSRNMTPMERTMTPGSYNPRQPQNPSRSDTNISAATYNGNNGYNRQRTNDEYIVSPVEPTLPSLEPSIPHFDNDAASSIYSHSTSAAGAGAQHTRAPSVASSTSTARPPYPIQNGRSTPSVASSSYNPYTASRPPNGRSTPSQSSNHYNPSTGRASPAPSQQMPYRGAAGRFPVNPARSVSAAPEQQQGGGYRPPVRNMTAPVERRQSPPGSYFPNDAPPRIGTPMGLRSETPLGNFDVGGGQNGLFSSSDRERDVERGYGRVDGSSGFKF